MACRVRIDLAYDGAGFHGWQAQPGLRTVQGELAVMLGRLLGREVLPVGAGRTDAGVHAAGQVCHVGALTADEADRLVRALARLAPEDILVRDVRRVSSGFNARFSALWRRYAYSMAMKRDLFRRRREWFLQGDLDREAMAAGAARFLGEHDYASFCKKDSLRENNTCTVRVCRFDWDGDSGIFLVEADRFLHHMVRTMVGTLVEVGRGRRRPDDIPAILAARDRGAAGTMAPAHGLSLEMVGYPEHLLVPEEEIP